MASQSQVKALVHVLHDEFAEDDGPVCVLVPLTGRLLIFPREQALINHVIKGSQRGVYQRINPSDTWLSRFKIRRVQADNSLPILVAFLSL